MLSSIRSKILVGICLLITAGVYFSYNPSDSPLFPPCPLLKLTGYQCPGCGSQRAIHHLLHLNVKEAFLCNPLVIPALLLIFGLVYLQHFDGKNRFKKLHDFLSSSRFILAVLAVVLLFGVGRNIV